MRRAVAPLALSFALALVPAARADDADALYDPAASRGSTSPSRPRRPTR